MVIQFLILIFTHALPHKQGKYWKKKLIPYMVIQFLISIYTHALRHKQENIFYQN